MKFNKTLHLTGCAGAILLGSAALVCVSYAQTASTGTYSGPATSTGTAKSPDPTKAKRVVERITPAAPPQVSTGTKTSAAGQNAADYKPKQKPLVIHAPPSP